ncbi:MAG: hypothetical protein HYU69_10850 [Bacteroidetes bacterium]|nr:hypothetical protein [Bacteroidota bacterium]
MKKSSKYNVLFTFLCRGFALCLMLFPVSSFSQVDSAKVKSDTASQASPLKKGFEKKITASFDTLPCVLKEGDIISKVLQVRNNSGKSFAFTIQVDHPPGWRSFNTRNRLYEVNNGDTIFVPVRVIPNGKIIGNTKYRINAYVLEKDSTPVATDHFYVIRNKLSNWEISVSPGEKIYFLNRENTTKFKVSISNNGNEDQEVVLGFENPRKSVIISDSTNRRIKNELKNLKLKPGNDTTFQYNATYTDGIKNQKRVDTESYNMQSSSETHTSSIYVNASEPLLSGGGLKRAKKVSFIKLGNQIEASRYGYSAFPLIMDANMYNIIGGQPILGINLRGSTNIGTDGIVNYYSQYFFSNSYYTNDYFMNSFNYIGYFDSKYSVEIGDIGGAIGGYGSAGKGLSAGYQFHPEHKVAAFYTRSRLFSNADREGFGAAYKYTPSFGVFNVSYTRTSYNPNSLTTDYFGGNASVPIKGGHSVSLGGFLANNNSTQLLNSYKRTGYQLFGGYSGVFFKDARLHTGLNGSYVSRYFEPNNSGSMINGGLTNYFYLNKKTALMLSNLYSQIDYKPVQFSNYSYFSQSFLNNLSTSFKTDKVSISPGLFYNVNYYERSNKSHLYHSRGISIGTGTYEYETNKLLSASVMAGYNREIGIQPVRDYFFLQFFSMYRYKVYSASLRYSYGNIAASAEHTNAPPQVIALMFNHQYQFNDPHLILQNYFSYSYYTAFQRQSLSYTPELYYYTNTGWRLKLSPGVYWSRSKSSAEGIVNGPVSYAYFGTPTPTTSTTVNIMVGVRKEFGIPNPFSKKRFYSLDFVAFVDVNGNNKRDQGEYLLENIVLRLGELEVLTNERGRASIKNIAMNKYNYSAFSLVDIEGFFPNIEDELNVFKTRTGDSAVCVPFVKGIKIYGKLVLDREKVAENTELPVDLGGITISAVNGKTIKTLTEADGSFQFYVPYGRYKLNMDERILGDRFHLLENNIELSLDRKTESMFITFYIVEKKRRINKKRFDANGHRIDDGTGSLNNNRTHDGVTTVDSEGDINKNPNAGKNLVEEANAAAASVSPRPPYEATKDAFLKDKTSVTNTNGVIYTVQLGAFQKPLNPNVFKGLKNLMYERIDNEFVRVTAGMISSEAEAQNEKDNLAKVGFPTAFVSAYNNGKNISLEDATKILNANKQPANKQAVGGKNAVKKPATTPAGNGAKSNVPATKGVVKKPATPAAKTTGGK